MGLDRLLLRVVGVGWVLCSIVVFWLIVLLVDVSYVVFIVWLVVASFGVSCRFDGVV